MKLLKQVGLSILVWVVGVAAFSWWLMWDLERNPIPANPDGSIPDSAGIPIAGFALIFFIFVLVANIALWINRFFKKSGQME